MKGLATGLLAVAVLLACVASNALCLGDNPEVEIDMAEKTSHPPSSTESSEHHPEVGLGTAGKTEAGTPIKIVPLGEAHAPGENATPVKLVPLGEAPADGTEIKTVFVPPKTENLPPENLPENMPENVPPENVPPGLEIRDGYWVSTVKPALHSARDTPITGLETLHSVVVISAEQASKLGNVVRAEIRMPSENENVPGAKIKLAREE